MRRVCVLLIAAALAACGPPQAERTSADGAKASVVSDAQAPDPIAAVRPIYDNYISGARSAAEGYYDPPLSAALKGAWDRFGEASQESDFGGALNFDPYVNAQDFDVASVEVSVVRAPQDGACVLLARFLNLGERTEVYYDMVLEDGAWRIDNVRSTNAFGEMNLRRILGGE